MRRVDAFVAKAVCVTLLKFELQVFLCKLLKRESFSVLDSYVVACGQALEIVHKVHHFVVCFIIYKGNNGNSVF